MKKHTVFQAFLGLILLLGLGWLGYSQLYAEKTDPARPQFEKGQLVILTQDGQRHSFDIEIARTEDEQRYGLMFKRHMQDSEGMLFLYTTDQPLSFWMRNTSIPLDMLFLQSDGRIINIAANAQPLDETPIRSFSPGRAVLEINGGLANRLGIAAGDRVLYPELPAD